MNDLCYHVYKPIPFGHKEEVRCLLCNEVVVGAPFAVDEDLDFVTGNPAFDFLKDEPDLYEDEPNLVDELLKARKPMTKPLVQHTDTAHATYVYLEDVPFRHARIDDYVTLYRALDDDRVVGFMVGDR